MHTFTAAVQARAEILECHLVAGVFDYLLKLRVSDVHAWREQVAAVVGSLPSVRDSRSYTVMEQVKHGNAIVL
jgi:Lrp/AsnC family leucine-responsive transcriptional regulator